MRKNIAKLAKTLTQDIRLKLGQVDVEDRPEYIMLDTLLNDEQAELMLHMKQRKPVKVAEMAKKMKWDEEHTQQVLEAFRACVPGVQFVQDGQNGRSRCLGR